MHTTGLTETQLIALLAAPEVNEWLSLKLGSEAHAVALSARGSIFEVAMAGQGYIFGHGDLHGYNAAVVQDDLGPKLAGAFDLENTGILDLHEDFFRLSLASEEMLDAILLAYQRLPGASRAIDRARIAVYYRACLFYLMVGKTSERLEDLHRLLANHLIYCGAHHGGLDE